MSVKERIRKVEAIVISHSDYGEADRILNLFTREMGKARAIAKGVRKEHSRKAGHVEPFTCTALMLAKGASFWIVSQAETVDAFAPIREDLTKTAQAAYVIELLERFTSEDEIHLALYRLVKDSLERIATQVDAYQTLRYFEMRFLEMVGYRPELFHCVQCRTEIQAEDQFFSILQGGVMCPRCGRIAGDTRPVSMLVLKYMRHFQRSDYKDIQTINVPPLVRQEMEKIMQSYLSFLAERKLNTPAFLREIDQPINHQKTPDDRIVL
jgi:DNA repair protein RecO (recombination protein O)